MSALTSSVYSSGAVDVYLSFDTSGSANAWIALPTKSIYNSTYTGLWTFTYTIDAVSIYWIYDAGLPMGPPNWYGTDMFFKVVCIAPSIMKKHPSTNWSNSAEVAQLPEVNVVLRN